MPCITLAHGALQCRASAGPSAPAAVSRRNVLSSLAAAPVVPLGTSLASRPAPAADSEQAQRAIQGKLQLERGMQWLSCVVVGQGCSRHVHA